MDKETLKRWMAGAATEEEILHSPEYKQWKKEHKQELDSLRNEGIRNILNSPEQKAMDSLAVLGREDAKSTDPMRTYVKTGMNRKAQDMFPDLGVTEGEQTYNPVQQICLKYAETATSDAEREAWLQAANAVADDTQTSIPQEDIEQVGKKPVNVQEALKYLESK